MTAASSDEAAEAAIRARRRLTNKLIADHQAERLRAFLDPAIKVVAGDGSLLMGADAVVQAFGEQFRQPGFLSYQRTTEAVTVDRAGSRAAESGRWMANWRGDGGASGAYLAVWRRLVGQWVIECELFVTLS